MSMPHRSPVRHAVLALCLVGASLVSASVAQESRAAATIDLEELDGARYHLIEARAEPGEKGHGLLVVLPGGSGTADFLPFVQNGILGAAPADFVGAMLTAVTWTDDQQIVWPTARRRVPRMKFTTEQHVAAVLADVRARKTIDPTRIVLLAWSSSGPAVYDIALGRDTPFERAYVAMSVFKPDRQALRRAKGRRFVLDQSPEDTVTPFRFAQAAHAALTENGAEVWLRRYAGGHGWHGAPLPRIEAGLAWLLGNDPAPQDAVGEAAAPIDGDDLLHNGGFERGTAGWLVADNSGSLSVSPDREVRHEGRQSLRLTKTGGMPLDVVRQDVEFEGKRRVQVSAQVRCAGAKNAFVKFFVYGKDDEVLVEDVDLVQLRGDRDWKRVARTYELPEGAVRGALMVVMVLGGEVWVDDARVIAGR